MQLALARPSPEPNPSRSSLRQGTPLIPQQKQDMGSYVERLYIQLPADVMKRIVEAHDVKLKVGGEELVLSDEYLGALRDLVERM